MTDSFKILSFLFEAASLKRTPRSGYQFLGRGRENVAEHSYGTAVIAFALSFLSEEKPDQERLLKLALFHDLPEARTGDLNYVNKRYVASFEDLALGDAVKGLPFESELLSLRAEWAAGESLEARLAADADQLDMMLELRRLSHYGWAQAEDWLSYAQKRLVTEAGLRLAKSLSSSDPDAWWFQKKDELWIKPKPPEENP
jgi:putative hydrolase of HD superfamily